MYGRVRVGKRGAHLACVVESLKYLTPNKDSQRIRANCGVLQQIAAFFGELRRFAANCGKLQRIAAICSVLRRIAAFCGELQKYHYGVSVNLWKFFGIGKIDIFHLTNLFKGGLTFCSELRRFAANCGCGVLQQIAENCSVLRRIAANCGVLQRFAAFCSIFAAFCGVLHRFAAFAANCGELRRAFCGILQLFAAFCGCARSRPCGARTN